MSELSSRLLGEWSSLPRFERYILTSRAQLRHHSIRRPTVGANMHAYGAFRWRPAKDMHDRSNMIPSIRGAR